MPLLAAKMTYRDLVSLETNIAPGDRAFRVLLGVVLVSLVFVGPQTPYGWIGLGPILTGLFGACPVYRFLGISTYSPHPGATSKAKKQDC